MKVPETTGLQGAPVMQLPALCMEDAHHAEDVMTGLALDLEIIVAADIVEEGHIGRAADRGEVQLHLDPPYPVQVTGADMPLGSFTVAF